MMSHPKCPDCGADSPLPDDVPAVLLSIFGVPTVFLCAACLQRRDQFARVNQAKPIDEFAPEVN